MYERPHVRALAELESRRSARGVTGARSRSGEDKYEQFLYPGTQHGFNNDTTPRYDAKASKLAWKRTIAFFNKHQR